MEELNEKQKEKKYPKVNDGISMTVDIARET